MYGKNKQTLCLYMNIKLSLNGTSNALITKPTIISVSPSSQNFLHHPQPNELRVNVDFSTLPYSTLTGGDSGELKDLAQLFTLKLYTTQSNALIETLPPSEILKQETISSSTTLTFIFTLPPLTVDTDLLFAVGVENYLIDKDGHRFTN